MHGAFDESGFYVNQAPYGEPQLGRRGLYPSVNSPQHWGFSDDSTMDHRQILNSVLTILSYADGSRDLIDIAEPSETVGMAVRDCFTFSANSVSAINSGSIS